MSKNYIILNGNNIVAYTNTKWLLRLYIYNRKNVSSYYIKKIENDEFETIKFKLDKLQIHYFYGYALTDMEIEYVTYMKDIYTVAPDIDDLKKKYNTKKIRKFVEKYKHDEFEYLLSLVAKCISNPGMVYSGLDQKAFFESLRGG